ncbi:MAG: Smr/MutS family protein [Prevotella sp.]|nr:Smr/MutS family protein [Prevotella sp.]
MIYPDTFEQKIGFTEIRKLLKERCMSTLGKELVDAMAFTDNAEEVGEWLRQVREFRRLREEDADGFPLQYFFDVREAVGRLRLANTHMEENEMWDLKRSLETIHGIIRYLNPADGEVPYPSLQKLTEGVRIFPNIVGRIDQILDKYGRIKDSASPELARIRSELARTEGSISRTLNNLLRAAQSEGLVEKDVTPAVRDGRLVIPVAPAMKRRIKGIVHDESASGKTVFIEPTEVVEANNRIRELEAEERREVVRILTEFADDVRPLVPAILDSYSFLGKMDFIQAKAALAETLCGIEPEVGSEPTMDWVQAVHPLLRMSLERQGKRVVPLDIMLTSDKRILIISGPNAGGKSVCLKTTGLLQYMLQCGLSVPIRENSKVGVFENLLIDIGDEQSIENDLSTYSSHLLNMKNMMRAANERTLILIDEFGTGTEPQIGGAIAESVLGQFCKKQAWGVITTHYQNLKLYADSHEGIANGAMLYDRHQMQALFQLQIGQPGSSFAIEIARKIGLPEEVINEASEIVGRDYIQSDKYLQDIVRDKRYWESKRQNVHQQEKRLQQNIEHYESELEEVNQQRKEILRKAKEEAEELLRESNKKIENAIREIRESQAEKEAARRIREELNAFREDISEMDTTATDETIERKMRQIQERRERKEKRKREAAKAREAQQHPANTQHPSPTTQQPTPNTQHPASLQPGMTVRIKGLTTTGKIESIDKKMATVIFGDMRTKMRTDRLERVSEEAMKAQQKSTAAQKQSFQPEWMERGAMTRNTIDSHRAQFKQDIDVRGMRGDEAINAVTYFIDDAILVGVSRVRILHGTGNGILRQLIRQYLATIPNVVHFQDEHIQFGGHGITVVDLG